MTRQGRGGRGVWSGLVLLPVAIAMLLAAPALRAAPEAGPIRSAAPTPRLLLTELTAQEWHELQPKEGSLLGSSFRILVNGAARAWLRREQPSPAGAIFLKLNRSNVSDLTGDPEWQRARLEVMRPAPPDSPSGNSWDFFMLGTLGQASPQGGVLPTGNCMGCHRRRSWRGQPLFVDFYAKPDAKTTPARLQVHPTGGSLTVTLTSR